jgi:calcineurin-like phosphoesterase family protein
MRYWLTGDTHFGHTLLQKYCRRPVDVDEQIKHNWAALIHPSDLVVHLGDVAFSFVPLREWLDALPGRKILVRGNHDGHTISWYTANGFDFACDGLILSGIFFTHRAAPILPEGARLNVHGHCHNRWPRGLRLYPHSRLFSLEYEGYQPWLLSSFLRSIEKETPYVLSKEELDSEDTRVVLARGIVGEE